MAEPDLTPGGILRETVAAGAVLVAVAWSGVSDPPHPARAAAATAAANMRWCDVVEFTEQQLPP